MEYTEKLSKCVCGRYPKLLRNDYKYFRYYCKKCNISSFHSREEICAREQFNSTMKNIDKLKVKI